MIVQFPSPFVRLPPEIIAIISSYYVQPIPLFFKKDILSYLRINDLIVETPPHKREELYNKIVFWLNIQRVLQREETEEFHPLQEINQLLFSSNRTESWVNPVYKRHFFYLYQRKELSTKFFYYINNNPFTNLGEQSRYFSNRFEQKIRVIWGLFTDRERLQFLIILPFFVGVNSNYTDFIETIEPILEDETQPIVFENDLVVEGDLVIQGDAVFS